MQGQRNTKWFWLAWVLATVVGYAVGTLVILPWMVMFAYAAQSALLTGLVGGAVLGAALGGAQWLVLRRHKRWVNGWWLPASIAGGMLGLGLGMELADMLTLPSLGVVTRGAALPVIAWQAALRAGVTGALVGLGLGGAQWLVMRRSIHRAGWWIIANGLGWLASLALSAALADLIGVLGALLLTSVTSGTITAWAMQRLRAASTLIIPPQSTTESTFE